MRFTCKRGALLCMAALVCAGAGARQTSPRKPLPRWRHLSSATGDLPIPGTSSQQTGAVVADLNGDGRMDILDKPYCWETPRVDVWLQELPAMGGSRP